MTNQNNSTEMLVIREQLNAVIALLIILLGEQGIKELLKKRRANKDIVRYFQTMGLSNKDLAGIFNTGKNSISNLKIKTNKKITKKIKKTKKN